MDKSCIIRGLDKQVKGDDGVSNELVLASDQGLPVFSGEGFEEHVETWCTVDDSMQNHLWMLGAIAASLEKKHGEDSTGLFASKVGRSQRTIRRFARTYREWEKRSALTVLSFQHHTIAARDKNPEKVLQMAHDNQWSTRELEAAVKDRNGNKDADEPEEEEGQAMMICPSCGGNGLVAAKKALKIRKKSK